MEIEKIELPDYLKDIVDTGDTRSLVTQSISVPRISIRGRQFRFVVDGDEISKQTEPINIIILGVEPEKGMAKTFYASGYVSGSSDPPDCSSWDGLKPDSWCDNPQSNFCAKCPKNIWGSAKSLSGKKAKACKESKRLIVLNPKDDEILYIFNVTIASLRALSEYGKFLINHKLPFSAVITQIAFVDSEFPQVEFKFGGILKEEKGKKMLERAAKREWKSDISSNTIENKPNINQVTDKPSEEAAIENIVEQTDESIDNLLENWG